MKCASALFCIGIVPLLLWGCGDNTQALKELTSIEDVPLGTAANIRMIYTDSARVQAILKAPKHIDYTHLSFQYSEFPEGVFVTFYDPQQRESFLEADYGILYNATRIIDLRGNVELRSSDGAVLLTDQLFWDAQTEWLFTEKPFQYTSTDYDLDGVRLDANKEFTTFNTGTLEGTLQVEESQDTIPQQ